MKSKSTVIVCALLVLCCSSPPTASQTLSGAWPQYRGPSRDGVSPETGLLDSWAETGPMELWRQPIGPSFAGIAIVGERVFTMESDGKHEYAVSLDAQTGKTIWRTVVGPFFEEAFGNGPRATPTIDGNHAYTLSSTGNLASIAIETGEVAWSLDFSTTFGSEVPRRGFSGSVLISGENVIAEPGAEEHGIVALDKETGKQVWSAGGAPAGYSSPIEVEFNGVDQLIFMRKNGAVAYSVDGDQLWNKEFAPDIAAKIAMPVVVAPDLLFFSASYDVGAMTLRMRVAGNGVDVDEVWRDRVMRNHFSTSVAVEDLIYGFDNATLKCIDARSGEQKWAKRGGLGKGSLIYADETLIVLSENGKLLLVEASPDGFVEKDSSQILEGRSWTSPSLASGTLYLRNLAEIVAIQLRH